MKISAIVPSAGEGERLKKGIDKVFVLLEKKPILYYTLKNLEKIKEIEEIILVVSSRSLEYTEDYFLKKFSFRKEIKVVKGGPTRTDSVWNGLKEVGSSTEFVLIHDGARPFVSKDLIKKVIETAEEFGTGVLGFPISSTVKRIKDAYVVETIDRKELWEIQTPQVFKKDLIISCYQKAIKENFKPTDDAQILERYGYRVKIVKGSSLNIKITVPEDLVLAKAILKI